MADDDDNGFFGSDDSALFEERDEHKAANGGDGQDQEPVQADGENSSTTWDTGEHSDAPGPFGTGGD